MLIADITSCKMMLLYVFAADIWQISEKKETDDKLQLCKVKRYIKNIIATQYGIQLHLPTII
jgi:hypothetical protein